MQLELSIRDLVKEGLVPIDLKTVYWKLLRVAQEKNNMPIPYLNTTETRHEYTTPKMKVFVNNFFYLVTYKGTICSEEMKLYGIRGKGKNILSAYYLFELPAEQFDRISYQKLERKAEYFRLDLLQEEFYKELMSI